MSAVTGQFLAVSPRLPARPGFFDASALLGVEAFCFFFWSWLLIRRRLADPRLLASGITHLHERACTVISDEKPSNKTLIRQAIRLECTAVRSIRQGDGRVTENSQPVNGHADQTPANRGNGSAVRGQPMEGLVQRNWISLRIACHRLAAAFLLKRI